MNYWIIKSEPHKYSWHDMKADGSTTWDGVRNYQARNNLRDMKKGDIALFYHSNIGLEIVGQVKIIKESYPDPTIDDDRWLAVTVKHYKALKYPVTLSVMKQTPGLEQLGLIRQGRLSVIPISELEYKIIMDLSKTKTY